MIFKVSGSNYFPYICNTNTYVSFCESKLDLPTKLFRLFLFNLLSQPKILNVKYEEFSHVFNTVYPLTHRRISCYVNVNSKNKLFCKLECLVPNQKLVKPRSDSMADMVIDDLEFSNEPWRDIISRLQNNAREDLVRYAPIRQRLDYQSIARRTFLVDQLLDVALPVYDRGIDVAQPIEVEFDEYNGWSVARLVGEPENNE